MGLLDDAKAKVQQLVGQDPQKVEEISDQALDKAAEIANEKTGGEHADTVAQARDAIDEKIGE